jgi:hypothetical protein
MKHDKPIRPVLDMDIPVDMWAKLYDWICSVQPTHPFVIVAQVGEKVEQLKFTMFTKKEARVLQSQINQLNQAEQERRGNE